MIEKRDIYLVAAAGVLAVNVAVAFHFYASGKQTVALKATRDSLSVVQKSEKAIREQRDAVASVLAEQIKRSDSTRIVYVHDKAKVTLKGDTAVTADSSQVLMPEVAARLRDADAHIANLEAENASLKFALRTDSALIKNQAEQIRLNQSIAKMVEGPSHFSHGLQIGVGGCLGGDGVKRACLYAGYGVEFRAP